MTDNDDLETSFDAPLTGREVGAWTLDILQAILDDHTNVDSPQTQAALARLVEINEPESTMRLMMIAASTLLTEARFQAALPPGSRSLTEHAEEIFKCSFLSARSIMRGDGPRNPFLSSSEG